MCGSHIYVFCIPWQSIWLQYKEQYGSLIADLVRPKPKPQPFSHLWNEDSHICAAWYLELITELLELWNQALDILNKSEEKLDVIVNYHRIFMEVSGKVDNVQSQM